MPELSTYGRLVVTLSWATVPDLWHRSGNVLSPKQYMCSAAKTQAF